MTLEVTLSNIEKLLATIAANTVGGAKAAKADKTTPAKETPKPADPAPVVETTTAVEDDFLGGDEPPAKELTKDDVRAVLVKYQQATTQENARKLLKKHGADTLGALKAESYAALAAEAAELTKTKTAVK